MRDLFTLPKFEPRPTPSLVMVFDYIISIPLLVFWGSGAWLVFEFLRGSRVLALVLFPFWAFAVTWASLALHRAGRVRVSVSAVTTTLLLTASWIAVTSIN